jgi:hypothetical protein
VPAWLGNPRFGNPDCGQDADRPHLPLTVVLLRLGLKCMEAEASLEWT